MNRTNGTARPIIIKRRKAAAAHAHHGGAWKVAYADFVTAMMAFFLLMWLLNATTEDQRIALATYFTPTISISNTSGGGDGALGGDSIFAEDILAQMGTGATDARPTEASAARGDTGSAPEENRFIAEDEDAVARALDDTLKALGGESNLADDVLRHIHTRVTDEGVVIDIVGLATHPLFVPGGADPTPRLRALIELVGDVLPIVSNDIAVSSVRQDGITPASGTARADAVAAVLAGGGLPSARIARVAGLSSAPIANTLGGRPDDQVTVTILRSDRAAD